MNGREKLRHVHLLHNFVAESQVVVQTKPFLGKVKTCSQWIPVVPLNGLASSDVYHIVGVQEGEI